MLIEWFFMHFRSFPCIYTHMLIPWTLLFRKRRVNIRATLSIKYINIVLYCRCIVDMATIITCKIASIVYIVYIVHIALGNNKLQLLGIAAISDNIFDNWVQWWINFFRHRFSLFRHRFPLFGHTPLFSRHPPPLFRHCLCSLESDNLLWSLSTQSHQTQN